jgi:N-acetylmuramic acid 6-phosphate etherase
MCVNQMTTEHADKQFVDLDARPLADAIAAMWQGQVHAVAAVRPALPSIARAVAKAAAVLGERGRLVYVGAGTSGRVAVQDGSELPPTFNWPARRVVFAIAGGPRAFVRSVEGAEDDAVAGANAMRRLRIGPSDVVIGVAASGTTPFTVAAIREARRHNALTLGIASNRATPLLKAAAHAILVETGSEAIAGSTRMKAGTAQKIVLNLVSTGIMLRLGRVYRGRMVNMRPTNEKLRKRAVAMVAEFGVCTRAEASVALDRTKGDIKLAVLLRAGLALAPARALLKRHAGRLRAAMAAIGADA